MVTQIKVFIDHCKENINQNEYIASWNMGEEIHFFDPLVLTPQFLSLPKLNARSIERNIRLTWKWLFTTNPPQKYKISYISAVTVPILTKLFGQHFWGPFLWTNFFFTKLLLTRIFLGPNIFLKQIIFYLDLLELEIFLGQIFLYPKIFELKIFLAQHFFTRNLLT